MDKNRWFACAKEAGFESFEIYQLLNEERSFTWFEGELDSYVTSHVLGTAFRGVIDSKMVNASSEDTSDDQMEDVIASMKQQAQMISNEEKADLRKPEEIKQEDKQIPVSANADVIRALLGETEKKILAFDERIFQVTDLVYEESRTIRTIVNTYGMDLKEVSGINVLVAGAAAKENEEIRNHYEFEPVDDAASFDSDDFVKQLCEKTVGKLGASTPASGEYPVIIERGAFTQLFGAYSSMFCGDAFRKGISPLCGKLNEKNLMNCFQLLIFRDSGMRENSMRDIVRRVEKVFSDTGYKGRVDSSDKRWLDNDIDEVFDGILTYLSYLQLKEKV
jgi:PmbA protein